jgi:hypothetical protein
MLSALRPICCLLLVLVVNPGLSAAEGSGTGLLASYYANETLSGLPTVGRIDAQVNLSWSGGAPASGLPVDSFSVRWDGEVEARFTENLTLIARTDDGVRLWLDGQLVIDAWVLRSAADSSYTFAAEAGRKYRIRMEYHEHFGSAVAQLHWQSASIARAAIPTAYLYPTPAVELPSGTGAGLLARYYANETLSGTPALARTDARVDFGWGGGSPDVSVPVESFSARWDGEIEARVSEPLTIIARTDDGVRVWLNGQVVIDHWLLRSAADSTYTFTAEAGQRYRIRMEYYEHTGAAVARLWWQSANEPKGPIPTSQLYPTDPVDPPNGTGTGLLASYFANETLSGIPVLSRTEARVDHNWAGSSPGAGVPADVFSARWLGEIEPRTSEPLTLIARTDDGVRLWIDGQLVIDQWILRGAADSLYTFPAEAGRRYTIRMEYFERYGSAVAKLWWQSASEPKAPIPTSQLHPTEPAVPPAGTGTGLFATYFANETLTGDPILSRVEPRIDHSWGGGSPGSPVPADAFSARWEGEIEPRVSEPLTLIARTDDGVRVWLDDVQVINAWILRGAADSTYTFTAVAGQRYRIRMEYFEHYGSAVAKLWWQSANEPRGPVPTSQLYPSTGTPTTPTIAFVTAGTTIAEDAGSTTVSVALSQATTTDVSVALQTSGTGATVPTTLTIPAGSTTVPVPVTIHDDPRFGPDRQATLSLADPVGATLGTLTSHVVTMQNTDAAPTIAFTTPTSFNLEQSGAASVIVRLSAVSAQTTAVAVALSGSASAGADYQAPATTLQIPADTFEGTIFIPLIADNTPEPDETIILTLSAPIGATLGSPIVHTITLSDGNQSPVIANGPTPAVNPVTGTSVGLSFSATDDGGAANLGFTWSMVGSVPAPVSFSPATGTVGTTSTTTATFTAPGAYTIRVQVRDAHDAIATAQTIVTVESTPTVITVAPGIATVPVLGTQAFSAAGTDQFGTALAQPLPVVWSVTGGGSIATNGVFTAGTSAGGPFTVRATLPPAQGSAAVTVIDQAPTLVHGPTVTVDAAATGLVLTALAADDGGEAALTYRWSVESGAPGTVSFTANDSNAAKNTTATISAAGTYTLRLTVMDAAGQAISATTPVTVAQRLSVLAIAPGAVSLTTGAEFDATLTGRDQFDAVMATLPSPMWSITGGATITPTATGAHLVAGAEAGGPFTLTAVSGTIQATATVTIVPPTGQAQTITFAPLPGKTYGDAAFSLAATASSGLPVSFSSSDPSVATVSGTMVTIVGAGTTTITAAQGGDASWDPAAPVVQPLVVAKAGQTITFAALPARTVADAPFTLTATAPSGLPVSYTSSHPDVATIAGDQVTIVGAGTTTITAIQNGGTNHLPADAVPQVLTVTKVPQTITFTAVSAKTYGDAPFALTATASSGLPVALASSDTSVVTIADGMVTIHAAGTTVITASQQGDATWDAATPVPQTLTVNKAAQTITFAALASRTVGDLPFTLTATASSGLPVSFTSSTPAVATVSGNTVTIVGAGTTTITAEQAGDGNHLAAVPVEQPLTITAPPKQAQTITFAALPAKTYGDAPFTLTATASSGLPVSYGSSDPGVATISGSTVTIVGGGTVTITATQDGDATWEAAIPVAHSLTIAKATQTITFTALSLKAVGDPAVTLGATTSSGLPVSYSSSNTVVATVSGTTLSFVGVGSALITASQAGDNRYLPAEPVIREQVVEPAKIEQFIEFYGYPYGLQVNDPPYQLYAYSYVWVTERVDIGGGMYYEYPVQQQLDLPITFTSSDPSVASISGNLLTAHAPGITTVTASQPGDSTYRAATPVSNEVIVQGNGTTPQTLDFPAVGPITYAPGLVVPLGATATSGLPVLYVNNSPWAATLNGSSLQILQAGSVNVVAMQLGDAVFAPAANVSQWITIERGPQTITFPSLPSKPANAQPFALTASSSSGLAISYTSSDPTVATVNGSVVTLLKSGTTTITARQSGNGNWLAADPVARTLTVDLQSQSITFAPIPALTLGSAPVTLQANATSGLPVSITSSDPSRAVVQGTSLYIIQAGSVVITAEQAGNEIYGPAQPVSQTLAIGSPTPPQPGTPTDWQADLAVDVDLSVNQSGSDPEVLEAVKYHYSKKDDIRVFVAGRSATGAYIDRIIVNLGDQQDEVTGASGFAEFPGLSEGEYDLSVQIFAHHQDDSGARFIDRFGTGSGTPYRMTVDRTKPELALLLPKRLWLDAGDRDPGFTEFPLVRNEPPRFWVNNEAEAWNKPLRATYSREMFGKGDLGNGIIAAVADATGLDKRIPTQAAKGRVLDSNDAATPLTVSILDQENTDEDRPDPEQASTAQRLLVKGLATLADKGYRLRLSAKDKAGNELDDVQLALFTVDTKAPTLHSTVAMSTAPFRFLPSSAVDEHCQLAWQGTEANEQTLMRSRWSQPFGDGGAVDGWRLNQPVTTAAPLLSPVGEPYAWGSGVAEFIVADVAGNRASGQVTLEAWSVGAGFASYVEVMPAGTFDRTRDRGDTFVNYRPEEEDPYYGQDMPWDDASGGPRAYTYPTESGIWALLGRVQKDEDGRYEDPYTWEWSFRRFTSRKHYFDEIWPSGDGYPDFLDRLGVASVAPLDPEVSPGNADERYLWPAIINIAPSWKPKATLTDSDRVRVAVTEKPAGYPFSSGVINIGATNDPTEPTAAQAYANGISRMLLPAREHLTSGFSNVGYGYIADDGAGPTPPGGEAPPAPFYDQEPVRLSPYSALAWPSGDIDYGNLTSYWLNTIRLSPDVVATGGVRTIRISAGFFTDQLRSDLFSRTGDYVRFRTQDDQDLTVPVSEYASKTAEELRNMIAIVSQRLIYPDGNVWQRQQLELQVAIGSEVAAALYHVDVKLGAVKAYSDELSQQYAGADGAHRMKEALNLVTIEWTRPTDLSDVDSEPRRVETFDVGMPVPIIALDSPTTVSVSADTARFRLTGSVRDPIADITPRGPVSGGYADIEHVSVEVDGQVVKTVSVIPGAGTGLGFWKPHAYLGRFDTGVITLPVSAGERQVRIVTSANAAGALGVTKLSLLFSAMDLGPQVPAASDFLPVSIEAIELDSQGIAESVSLVFADRMRTDRDVVLTKMGTSSGFSGVFGDYGVVVKLDGFPGFTPAADLAHVVIEFNGGRDTVATMEADLTETTATSSRLMGRIALGSISNSGGVGTQVWAATLVSSSAFAQTGGWMPLALRVQGMADPASSHIELKGIRYELLERDGWYYCLADGKPALGGLVSTHAKLPRGAGQIQMTAPNGSGSLSLAHPLHDPVLADLVMQKMRVTDQEEAFGLYAYVMTPKNPKGVPRRLSAYERSLVTPIIELDPVAPPRDDTLRVTGRVRSPLDEVMGQSDVIVVVGDRDVTPDSSGRFSVDLQLHKHSQVVSATAYNGLGGYATDAVLVDGSKVLEYEAIAHSPVYHRFVFGTSDLAFKPLYDGVQQATMEVRNGNAVSSRVKMRVKRDIDGVYRTGAFVISQVKDDADPDVLTQLQTEEDGQERLVKVSALAEDLWMVVRKGDEIMWEIKIPQVGAELMGPMVDLQTISVPITPDGGDIPHEAISKQATVKLRCRNLKEGGLIVQCFSHGDGKVKSLTDLPVVPHGEDIQEMAIQMELLLGANDIRISGLGSRHQQIAPITTHIHLQNTTIPSTPGMNASIDHPQGKTDQDKRFPVGTILTFRIKAGSSRDEVVDLCDDLDLEIMGITDYSQDPVSGQTEWVLWVRPQWRQATSEVIARLQGAANEGRVVDVTLIGGANEEANLAPEVRNRPASASLPPWQKKGRQFYREQAEWIANIDRGYNNSRDEMVRKVFGPTADQPGYGAELLVADCRVDDADLRARVFRHPSLVVPILRSLDGINRKKPFDQMMARLPNYLDAGQNYRVLKYTYGGYDRVRDLSSALDTNRRPDGIAPRVKMNEEVVSGGLAAALRQQGIATKKGIVLVFHGFNTGDAFDASKPTAGSDKQMDYWPKVQYLYRTHGLPERDWMILHVWWSGTYVPSAGLAPAPAWYNYDNALAVDAGLRSVRNVIDEIRKAIDSDGDESIDPADFVIAIQAESMGNRVAVSLCDQLRLTLEKRAGNDFDSMPHLRFMMLHPALRRPDIDIAQQDSQTNPTSYPASPLLAEMSAIQKTIYGEDVLLHHSLFDKAGLAFSFAQGTEMLGRNGTPGGYNSQMEDSMVKIHKRVANDGTDFVDLWHVDLMGWTIEGEHNRSRSTFRSNHPLGSAAAATQWVPVASSSWNILGGIRMYYATETPVGNVLEMKPGHIDPVWNGLSNYVKTGALP